mmetsp:Transcript_10783/g.17864  ORF Transcript_10783/g.17864 Transcript_10783/m.17864 type:complete len:528 (-) Transcript_10783:624-2207(-)
MPIDIDLLRSDEEGGILEAFLESQCLRFADDSPNQDEVRTFLQTIQAQDVTRRTEGKELEQQRNSLKSLQRSLAPNSKVEIDKNTAKKQIKQLKEAIQGQQDKLKADELSIHQNLLLVGNLIDKELGCKTYPGSEAIAPPTLHPDTVLDPVFCLGGHEKLQIEGPSSFTTLSGHVAELARAITTYSIFQFKGERFPLASLPESIPLSADVAHLLLGCQPRDCQICASRQQQFPSFLAASMLHRGKIYWDRALPRGTVCLTTNQHLWDRKESTRLDSFNHTKRKWFEEVKSEQVGFLGMTICTLEDSRKLQLELADRIVGLHMSLLAASDGLNLTNPRHEQMVRKRSISPSQLQPCEASRIVVEGYLQGEYVCLGMVSNTTDFLSRAMKTRCGGSHVEYVHSVYATCCSVNETLEWLVQNNILEDSGELGVGIPPVISKFMGYTDGEAVFLPFQRRLHPGKGGRKPVVKELTASSPRAIGKAQRTTTSEDPVVVRKPKVPFALHRLPNRDEVIAERYASPFDFLPEVR